MKEVIYAAVRFKNGAREVYEVSEAVDYAHARDLCCASLANIAAVLASTRHCDKSAKRKEKAA